MKRLSAIILVLSLSLLMGCSNSGSNKSVKAEKTTKERDTTAIGFTEIGTETDSVDEEQGKITPEEQLIIDTLAEADASYESGDYADAITVMMELEDYADVPVYTSSVKHVANDAVNALCANEGTDNTKTEGAGSSEVSAEGQDPVQFLISLPHDDATAAAICDTIISRCEEGSYNAFLLADELIAAAGEDTGNLEQLVTYVEENDMKRAANYINADWERTDSKCPLYLFVAHITFDDDDNSGYLTYVNQSVNTYGFKVGDQKFKDIKFVSDTIFSCQNMGRYASNYSKFWDYAEAYLDYENDMLVMDVNVRSNNVSGSAQHWRRISTEQPMVLVEETEDRSEEVDISAEADEYSTDETGAVETETETEEATE